MLFIDYCGNIKLPIAGRASILEHYKQFILKNNFCTVMKQEKELLGEIREFNYSTERKEYTFRLPFDALVKEQLDIMIRDLKPEDMEIDNYIPLAVIPCRSRKDALFISSNYVNVTQVMRNSSNIQPIQDDNLEVNFYLEQKEDCYLIHIIVVLTELVAL